MRRLNWLRGPLIAIGCWCLLAVGIELADAAWVQRTANEALDHKLMASAAVSPIAPDGLIGRLEIPRLDLSVVVFNGDDDETLARAVGHVRGTAFPWESGNAVMAGHRDTFFRPLKNIREGDAIRLTTVAGTFDYHVMRTEIVEPDDVSALAPTPFRSLTLVTCYPFVYIGRAPERFIIHAR